MKNMILYTHTHTRTHLLPLCIYKKELVPLFPLVAVLSLANFSAVITNCRELWDFSSPASYLRLPLKQAGTRGGGGVEGEAKRNAGKKTEVGCKWP